MRARHTILIFIIALAVPLRAADITLDRGLGSLHYPVSTKNAEAQRYFDQGMRYVYAFNHEQAVASFKKATALDPDLALGYWGAALALGPNINMDVDPDREKQAYDSVQAALAHASHASAKERDLINALSRRYSIEPGADLKKLSAAYSDAMRAVAAKYPADDDIATLFAESLMDLRPWKFWTHDGKPAEGTQEIVRVLETVLKRNPNHMGANHYYIHAVEASSNPARALRSANRLKLLAPAAGHLVHMPAHIYERTGNYAGAAAANEAGARADRDFFAKYGAESMYAGMYYNHNLDFGAASLAMIGDFAKAKAMADEVSSNAAKMVSMMPMIEGATSDSVKVLLRFGRWNDVLRGKFETPGPLSATMLHFARGVAFAQVGNVAGAQSEEKEFEASRAKIAADEMGVFQNPEVKIVEVADHLLDGRIAMARGDRVAAIAAYRLAVAAEDALDYDEPSDWFYPTRESLGAALLRDGQFIAAEKVFREDLARNKNNPRSLYGLARALRGQKKSAGSTSAQFAKLWRGGAIRIEDL
jgi:tetratricopeptide (TPR) repeat protein